MKPDTGCDDDRTPVPVYILAGGRSRRFGRDKARVVISGRPVIRHIAEALSPIASRFTVVARRAGEYTDLGFRTIGDVVTGKGPMGGLLTALVDHGRSGWIFVTACDWLGMRAEWAIELRRYVCSDVCAVVYRAARYEPLFGFYHTSIRETVEQHVSQEKLSMQTLLADIRVAAMPSPFAGQGVVNMNRPPGPFSRGAS